jgi:hypothetical protein
MTMEERQAEIRRNDPYATGESVLLRAAQAEHNAMGDAHGAWCAGIITHVHAG